MLNIIAANFKLGWNYNLNYRASLFLGTIAKILSLMFIIFLWLKIFETKDNIGGYTLAQMLTYYLFAIITRNILTTDIAKTIGYRIKDGTMQILLLRPGHPLVALFGFSLSKIFVQLIIFIIFVLAVAPLALANLEISLSLIRIFSYLLIIGIGLILVYLISSLVGVLAFWLVNVYPVFNSFMTIFNILSGSYIPLVLFPNWAQGLVMFLPFHYLVYDPVRVLQGRLVGEDLVWTIVKIIIWIVVLLIFNCLLWQKGFKRFDAVGN